MHKFRVLFGSKSLTGRFGSGLVSQTVPVHSVWFVLLKGMGSSVVCSACVQLDCHLYFEHSLSQCE